MLEPRGAVHSTIFRREASTITTTNQPIHNEEPLLFEDHEEPKFPIHPALEYEIRAPQEQQQPPQQSSRQKITGFLLPEPNRRRKRIITDMKLCTSFVLLVLSGVGTVTFTKLQTIPM